MVGRRFIREGGLIARWVLIRISTPFFFFVFDEIFVVSWMVAGGGAYIPLLGAYTLLSLAFCCLKSEKGRGREKDSSEITSSFSSLPEPSPFSPSRLPHADSCPISLYCCAYRLLLLEVESESTTIS